MKLFAILSILSWSIPHAFGPHAFGSEVCPRIPSPGEAFETARKFTENEIKKFSSLPVVATEADATLSKLISQQSPAILDWMKARNFESKSEDEIAYEWREYYVRTFVLSRYPHPIAKINPLIESVVEKVYQHAFSKPRRERFEKLFKAAQNASILRLQEFPLPKAAQDQAVARVRAIQIHFMDHLKGSGFEKNPLEAISWSVAYDPRPNRINVGINALRHNDDETLFAVFAHEIGHSFDPCRWKAFLPGQNPFENVVTCLRMPQSVGAKKRDDSQMIQLLKSGRMSEDAFAAVKDNPTCNRSDYPPIGVQADQAPEAFADWFSAEVVSQSPYAKPGMRADLCEETKLQPGSSYVPNRTRLLRIYMAHPKLRNVLRLDGPGDARYCSLTVTQ